MSAFASAIQSGSSLNVTQLLSELNSSLPVRKTSASSASLVSTTATNLSPTSLISQAVSLAADELAVFITTTTLSCGTIDDRIVTNHQINSVDQNNYCVFQGYKASTAGNTGSVTQISWAQDLSGTITFAQTWGREGSGTIYSLRRDLFVLQFKRR